MKLCLLFTQMLSPCRIQKKSSPLSLSPSPSLLLPPSLSLTLSLPLSLSLSLSLPLSLSLSFSIGVLRSNLISSKKPTNFKIKTKQTSSGLGHLWGGGVQSKPEPQIQIIFLFRLESNGGQIFDTKHKRGVARKRIRLKINNKCSFVDDVETPQFFVGKQFQVSQFN